MESMRVFSRCPSRLARVCCVVAVLLVTCAGSGWAGVPPVVSRVEPPGWWADHSVDTVRVLLSGSGLVGARLEAPSGYAVSKVLSDTNGVYLFASLGIPHGAKPGTVRLKVTTSAGEVIAPFQIMAPPARKGRFAGFSPDDTIYLLMPDRFADGDLANDNPPGSTGITDRSKPRHYHGGDFKGVRDHLSYIKALGATALWMTPWYDNVNHLNQLEKYDSTNQRSRVGAPSTDYHGYGAVDFYGVEEHFGTLAQLRNLVDTAHRSGLKVIQDQVANHTGPYHTWAAQSPTPTWFNGTVQQHLENTWQTWTIADPNPPQEKLKSTLDGWFINLLPDLNQNDPETAAYLLQNSLWWVGMTGVDAVRQDTLPYVPRSYWSRWTAALKREYPHLVILGEMWDGNPKLVSFFQGGRARFDGVDSGVDTLFDFPLHYALRDVFVRNQPMTRISETLAADTNYVDASVLVTFLGLHDTGRFMGEKGATIEGLKLAFSALLTMRGTPMIYYGDEIGMEGGGDPDNRRDFPGGWREDKQTAFVKGGRTPNQEAVHGHVARLLSLRRQLEPLRRGALREIVVEKDIYAFARTTSAQTVLVAINNATEPRRISVPQAGLISAGKAHVLSDKLGALGRVPVPTEGGGPIQLTLPAKSAAILVPE